MKLQTAILSALVATALVGCESETETLKTLKTKKTNVQVSKETEEALKEQFKNDKPKPIDPTNPTLVWKRQMIQEEHDKVVAQRGAWAFVAAIALLLFNKILKHITGYGILSWYGRHRRKRDQGK